MTSPLTRIGSLLRSALPAAKKRDCQSLPGTAQPSGPGAQSVKSYTTRSEKARKTIVVYHADGNLDVPRRRFTPPEIVGLPAWLPVLLEYDQTRRVGTALVNCEGSKIVAEISWTCKDAVMDHFPAGDDGVLHAGIAGNTVKVRGVEMLAVKVVALCRMPGRSISRCKISRTDV